jgi:hypothetical protein
VEGRRRRYCSPVGLPVIAARLVLASGVIGFEWAVSALPCS